MYFNKKLLSIALALVMVLGTFVMPVGVFAEGHEITITILGTTDLHANIYNYSYENGEDVDNLGMAKVYSVIQAIREDNPNALLVDNGDTIQGTILSDDLYNTRMDLEHPVIDVMNFMGYDSMVLGNHEFNFGVDLVDKIVEEAEFPILGANVKYAESGDYLTEPYVIIEVEGVKVGILGLTNPNIPRWDGPKVTELEFTNPVESVGEHIDQMKEDGADIIIVTAHMGYEEEYAGSGDGAELIIEAYPEIAAVLTGHAHVTESQKVGNTLVGGAADAGEQVVRFDFDLVMDGDEWTLADSRVEVIDVVEYPASEELREYAAEYHQNTLDFLVDVIGVVEADFAPPSEIPGIPEAQIRDTAVIDLINNVQLEATGADVAGAALFSPNSNLEAGDVTYADIFGIYKYPNTLIGIEVTGEELKDYMEWSASYYNTYAPGDINISFNPNIRGYNYDMFQGVEYKVDVTKPAGERIVDLMFNGEPLLPEDTLKLAINNYRYGGLKNMEIISGTPYFESDPKSLRSYIADYIAENTPIAPEVDNNWEVIGADLEHPLRPYLIEQIIAGNLEVPVSEDGRSYNAEAINANDMILQGLIPDEVLAEYGIVVTPVQPVPEPEPVPVPEPTGDDIEYIVKPGDWLSKIAITYGVDWRMLAEYNELSNPNLIYPGQKIMIPRN